METVLKAIGDWLKSLLTAGIMSNLSGLFDDVNTQVGNIAQQVSTKPSAFKPRVFAMIEALSKNVVLPIAGIILTFIACYELIEMITQHNNMAQFEPALIMRWIFKTAVSVWLISNTFDIVMAVFDLTQKVVADSSGIIAKGNNGLTKTKFLTYGIEGESMAQVKPRLEHIQNDLMNNFHRLGVLAKPLDGRERLKLMHGMLNMDGSNKFHFAWKDLVPSGLSVKDAIAPTALAFKNSRTFQMGGIFGAVSFLSITASDLSDQLLKDFLDMESSQIVTMHIQSVDQNKAIKTVKHTIL